MKEKRMGRTGRREELRVEEGKVFIVREDMSDSMRRSSSFKSHDFYIYFLKPNLH